MKLLCETRSYGQTANTHDHDYSQLILPLAGQMTIKTSNYDLKLDKRHLFYLPKDCSHTFYADSKNRFLVVDIPDEVQRLVTQNMTTDKYLELDQRWQAMRYLIGQEAKRNNPKAMLDLMRNVFSYLSEDLPKSIGYIHDHFTENIRLKELAAMENYHTSHYVLWFKKHMGMTPNHYIQELRLKKAVDYLQVTNYKLSLIAQLVGYEHQSSLNRLFSKFGYMPPANYRKIQVSAKNK